MTDKTKESDESLWQRVMASVKAYRSAHKAPQQQTRKEERKARPPQPVSAKSRTAYKQTHPFDPKLLKSLTKKRIRPQARLDLHGMTTARAHDSVRKFVHDSHRKGLRILLIVTGKGHRAGTGSIKREFPHWLEEPALSKIVISSTSAPPHLGGSGAQILHLRKSK